MSAEAVQSHRLLFLDDDPKLLETVGALFQAWSQGAWQIHLAQTSAKALSILQEHPMHLAVIDISMPVVDGLQFMQLLSRKHPTLIKVVLTGLCSDERRAAAQKSGAELYLEKPRSAEGWEIVFATLKELVSLHGPPQEGFRGLLRTVGLPEVLQMECLGRKSSLLEIATPTARGQIYIENGSIVHAEMGPFQGEEAFNSLLGLAGGEFHLKPYVEPPKRTIEGQWEFLLMEAARVRDEVIGQTEFLKSQALQAGVPLGAHSVPLDTVAAAQSFEELLAAADEENGTTESATAPNDDTPSAPPAPPNRIEELLVCSRQGDVLYEWRCPDLEARLKLFEVVARRAAQMAKVFPLGSFDRLEMQGPQGRAVTQLAADRRVFVRSAPKVSS